MNGGPKFDNDVTKLKTYVDEVFGELDRGYEKNNKKINTKLDAISDCLEKTNTKLSCLSKKIEKLEKNGII